MQFKNKIIYHIKNTPLISIRKTAKKLKVHERAVGRTLKQLGTHSYVRSEVQLHSEASKLASSRKEDILLDEEVKIRI